MRKSLKRKINYKLKRTVRRTLGAIFMISAIIVAAIPPVPQQAAEGTVAYDVTKLTDDVNMGYPASLLGGAGTDSAKVLRQLSDNTWQIDWQFKYYLGNFSAYGSGTKGVITQYNDTYAAKEVDLSPNINVSYFEVSASVYATFYATNLKATTAFVVTDLTVDKASAFMTKYFKTEYDAFVANYNAYLKEKAAYDAWVLGGKVGTAPTVRTAPTLTKTPSTDLSNDQKLTYYCDCDATLATYTYYLQAVNDASSGTNVLTYVARTDTPTADAPSNYKNDSNGFLVTSTASLIAIGNGAFNGVKNVDVLNLPSEIGYIGDEAFQGSFVKSVSFTNVAKVGNRAFKNCSQLTSVSMGDGTSVIGAEAFYGCGISQITFPYSIETIGPGAFAACQSLKTADFSKMTVQGATLENYSFFNDIALDTVNFGTAPITKIGDGAFAATSGVTGGLTAFTFPSKISEQANMGTYILANRTNLKTVVMPAEFGRQTAVVLPPTTFDGCMNLASVEFPDDGNGSCGYVSYGKSTLSDNTTKVNDIFSDVITETFFVKGPATDRTGAKATPRTSTWSTTFNGTSNTPVPYVYKVSGVDYIEVSNGNYIYLASNTGELTSCELVDPTSTASIDFVLPSKIGTYSIKTLKEGCFSTEFKNNLKTLTISDDTLSEIGASVFADCPKLESVTIGNSVTKIGASAFENCGLLTEMTFHSPTAGTSSFPLANIGASAFSTGSTSLTITGDIATGYGPYEWAMQADNYIDTTTGKRVCYKSPAPQSLTVMLDNRNNYPTLLDYPHYENLDTTIQGAYESAAALTPAQESALNAVFGVGVPSGIKSIDSKGFMNNTSPLGEGFSEGTVKTNTVNRNLYLTSGVPYSTTYGLKGLFNGSYQYKTYSSTSGIMEYDPTSADGIAYETVADGNDRLQAITLNSVKYLPDEAFASCERLGSVTFGADIADLGTTPFVGCTNLKSVAFGNSTFVANNGIIYKNNADGTRTLVECLSSRGNPSAVGQKLVNVENDPFLATVTAIEPGAFKECDYVTRVDLTGATKVTEIPESCFEGASILTQVILPTSVTAIDDYAFKDAFSGLVVTVPGKEVSLADTAFKNISGTATLYSYKDSAVYTAAKKLGLNVEPLENTYKVQFFDHDGTELSAVQYVASGKDAEAPTDPTRTGYTFAGWSKSYKKITADTVIIATYKLVSTTTGGTTTTSSTTTTTTSSATTYALTVTKGTGGGTYASGTTVTITANAPDAGYTFSGWTSSTSGVTFASASSATTTISMPASAATVVANYTESTKYALTVTDGSGSGSYASGTKVTITANTPPAGKVFDKWTTTETDLNLGSTTASSTTLTMAAHTATVVATYKDAPPTVSANTAAKTTASTANLATTGTTGNSSNGTTVDISKSGISNTDKASASVSGSTDNFIVKISESSDATAAVQKALAAEYGDLTPIKYFAMDISLYDATGTTKLTNTDGLSVNITMPIPDALLSYAGNNKTAGVVNEKLDKLTPKFTTIDGVDCITFTATHFSPYTVYVDTANLTAGSLDATPKTGDGIHPKWFLALGLALISIILFIKRDPAYKVKPS